MTHVMGRLTLIVNARAGRGRVRDNLPLLRRALDERGLDHDVVETHAAGSAVEAARAALEAGSRYLVAVGGDGTVHETVNGMFQESEDEAGYQPVSPRAILGVAAMGSGCDFIRTFGLDRKPEILARHFASETIMPVDVGVVTYTLPDGRPGERLFVNVGEAGYGAEVVRKAARYPRWFGRFRYLFGAYAAIRSMQRPDTTVHLAHADVDRPVVALIAANAQYFGGGMKVAPRALPDDGKFNVQIFSGQRSQVFLMTQQLYRGEHVPHPQISEYQSPTVSLDPPVPLAVEADGELLGTTPATFRLLPRALRLKI
jgi:YegS/Rv2252/BmrU family lipid kinase